MVAFVRFETKVDSAQLVAVAVLAAATIAASFFAFPMQFVFALLAAEPEAGLVGLAVLLVGQDHPIAFAELGCYYLCCPAAALDFVVAAEH